MAGLVGLGWLPWQAQLGHRLSQGGRAARRLAWHRRTTRLQPAGTAGRLIRDEQTDKKVDQDILFMKSMTLEDSYFSHFSDACSLGLLSLAIFTSNYSSVRISAFNPWLQSDDNLEIRHLMHKRCTCRAKTLVQYGRHLY